MRSYILICVAHLQWLSRCKTGCINLFVNWTFRHDYCIIMGQSGNNPWLAVKMPAALSLCTSLLTFSDYFFPLLYHNSTLCVSWQQIHRVLIYSLCFLDSFKWYPASLCSSKRNTCFFSSLYYILIIFSLYVPHAERVVLFFSLKDLQGIYKTANCICSFSFLFELQ